MMVIDNKYSLGQSVYLKTDKEQLERVVTGITQRPSGVLYLLSCGVNESPHYDIEISVEKNILTTTTN